MHIIAIDPDTQKSGIAHYHPQTKQIETAQLTFPQLIDYLTYAHAQAQEQKQKIKVVVEAGWLNAKSNFHGGKGAVAQRIAKNVGANHETGKKIIEIAQHIGLPTIPQRPLRKIWKGTNKKITHQELTQLMKTRKLPPLPTTRTNQDQRDAILICLHHTPSK